MSNVSPLPADSAPEKLFRGGILDVRNLEIVTPDWMLARLKGHDPYLPIDHDNLELPHRIFVVCWLEAAFTSPLRESIGRASVKLLNLAWDSEPEDWVKWLLRLVATIRPASCLPFLISVTRQHHFSPSILESGLDRLWLEAAAAYDPQPQPLFQTWAELLRQGPSKYRAIAYSALSHSIDLAIYYLPDYYLNVPVYDRPLLLREAVRDILNRGTESARRGFDRHHAIIEQTSGLAEAVKSALAELDAPPALADPICSDKYSEIAHKELRPAA